MMTESGHAPGHLRDDDGSYGWPGGEKEESMAIEKQLEELSTQIAELIVAVRTLGQLLTPANAAAGSGRIIEPPPRPAGGTQRVLVTVTEAAEILSCSPASIRVWIRRRELPSVKVGRLVRPRLG
jgi:excisionase family DNA binding protein